MADRYNFELSPREPVGAEIARKLMDYLLFSGEVTPGDRLPSERSLAESFGVGRSAVREALKSLSLIGLVDVRQGDGTYLKKPDSELLPRVIEWGLLLGERRVIDLIEARKVVEVACARFAAERRDDDDIADLKQLLEEMAEAEGDVEAFVEADISFHLRIAQSAKSTVLSDMLSGIQALLRVWIRRVIEAAGESGSSHMEHIPVLDAVIAGDGDAASDAMSLHMEMAGNRLFDSLQDADLAAVTVSQ